MVPAAFDTLPPANTAVCHYLAMLAMVLLTLFLVPNLKHQSSIQVLLALFLEPTKTKESNY